MNLNSYILLYGIEEAERLFIKAGSKPTLIPHIRRGARRPSLNLIERLVAESNGKIKFKDMLPAQTYLAIRKEIIKERSSNLSDGKIEATDKKTAFMNEPNPAP